MQKNLSNKELVAAGHKFAANISADTPLLDMAKMVSELATSLDVALAAAAEAGKQRGAVMTNLADMEDKLRIKQNHIKLRDTYIEELEQRAESTEACTNSLNNAQEALKSAGIEADTVQAGVMELKAQRDALAAENGAMRELIVATGFKSETPATDAYIRELRNEAGARAVELFSQTLGSPYSFRDEKCYEDGFTRAIQVVRGIQAPRFAAQLRAGNAGKDGV